MEMVKARQRNKFPDEQEDSKLKLEMDVVMARILDNFIPKEWDCKKTTTFSNLIVAAHSGRWRASNFKWDETVWIRLKRRNPAPSDGLAAASHG